MPVTDDATSFQVSGPDDAPCIALIHGLGLNQASWQWTVPYLATKYRTLTFDLYGHGRSGPPNEDPSLSLFSKQLQSLLDQCGIEQATIVGFSLGGMIARRFAQDTPERTRALAILHSAHTRSETAQNAIAKRVEQARLDGASATVDEALQRWFTSPFRGANPDTMALVRSWVTANRQDIYYRNYRVLSDGVSEVVAPNPPIACPTLVMTADEDFGNSPTMARAIAAEIAGAQTIILKGLRHMAIAENPKAVNEPLLEFLSSVYEEYPR